MDDILFDALTRYYHALELKGYMSIVQSVKLLVLCFYRDFMFHDYRGLLSKKDYCLIERALDCIYGTSCLIPYPDYLKMGKLHLGEITEMAQRVKTLEDTNVVKVLHNADLSEGEILSDVVLTTEDD